MNSRYVVFAASIATLMSLTSTAFTAPQGEFKTPEEKHCKGVLETPPSNTVYTTEKTNINMFYFEKTLPPMHASAVMDRTRTLLAQAGLDAVASREEIGKELEQEGEMTREQVAELMANPFSYLWFGMVQNDTYWWEGDALDALREDDKIVNTTLIQPVMSLAWSENWRLIFRPVIPIQSVDTVTGFNFITDEPEGPRIEADFDRETGLGDIVLWTAFSPQYTPPLVYGFGPTIIMDTASDKWLGTGKWSAGPMATIAYITDKWVVGGIAQHWWSFAGDGDRNDVSLTDFQPLIRYRVTPTTNIGTAPNIRYNWEADSGDRLQLPIGGGIATVVMLGKLPVGIGIEYYYYAESPDFLGPDHQIRVFFSPVLPSPAWSRVPIFGK